MAKKVGEDVEQIIALTDKFKQDIEAASSAFKSEATAAVEAAADALSTSLSGYSRKILQLTRNYVYELNVILGNTNLEHPSHPIVLPGDPSWGTSDKPEVEPPIVIPPDLDHPSHPIVLPGDPSWGTNTGDHPDNSLPIVIIPPGNPPDWNQIGGEFPSTGPVGPQPKK